MTDAEIVRGCRAGRRDAWKALVERHGPAVEAALRACLRGLPQIEDDVQAFWAHLMEDAGRRLEGYDPARALTPWLVTVALNLARKRLRRPRGASLDNAPEGVSAPDPAEGLEREELRRRMGEAMESLSPRDRLILRLAVIEGLPHARVALALGVKPDSVSVLAARAGRRLRSAVGTEPGEG